MQEKFIEWNPRHESLSRVEEAIEIIDEYQAQGLRLTLRQLYYQFVARDLIPNTPRSYKNLGGLIGKARMAGLIDWEAIEDRGREPDTPQQFEGLGELVDTALRAYRLDRWAGQDDYCELWVEKAALAGVLLPIARRYHVTLMVNKGYSSLSAMYESAQRIMFASEAGARPTTVFYLGDFDPSGEDMVRDIQDRLDTFTRGEVDINVDKIALTWDQIRKHRPPPNPAKLTDSRAAAYIRKHGRESWEVDALDPKTLQHIIETSILSVLDVPKMDAVKAQEDADRIRLRTALSAIEEE